MRDIQCALCRDVRVRLWRNNVGVLQDARGNYVGYGLTPGSSDLIGLRSLIIKPDMVGKTVAVFVALEIKGPRGRPTLRQGLFVKMVNTLGGLAGIVRSLADARRVLTGL
jgi:hypothetical protein